ncbi:hypothetical protein COCON_G00231700 [Conger conger]|uniref:Uncharacterized protein n=1 Tax=Conger conger TaxID=82655 RepID=A0A9Q1CVN2_CONCO|nr:hypothetical protein COCON_G00231700 [Conger conger]
MNTACLFVTEQCPKAERQRKRDASERPPVGALRQRLRTECRTQHRRLIVLLRRARICSAQHAASRKRKSTSLLRPFLIITHRRRAETGAFTAGDRRRLSQIHSSGPRFEPGSLSEAAAGGPGSAGEKPGRHPAAGPSPGGAGGLKPRPHKRSSSRPLSAPENHGALNTKGGSVSLLFSRGIREPIRQGTNPEERKPGKRAPKFDLEKLKEQLLTCQ